ncbi:MAG: acetyl-CoA C-acyltransferase, partial [Gammaproteobacteria bacterium]|nr:acetyl-CoA C-acyltransferase [Gammaproteobacteria bacterium]
MTQNNGRPVYFVDGARTPFLKVRSGPGAFSAADLAVNSGRALLSRHSFSPTDLDEVILGSAMPMPDEANIGRVVALRLGCGHQTPGYTVMRNCASAMQALDSAAKDIQIGRADLVLAGGTEAMSRAPVLFNNDMVGWLGRLNGARSLGQKLAAIAKFRPRFLKPVIGLLKGLTDPVVDLNMGQTCEVIAHRFDVTRQAMDEMAVDSHLRLAAAFDNDRMTEVTPLYDPKRGEAYVEDTGLRRDSNVEKLSTLKPVFDRRVGLVTAANSSQITDGAAWLLMASE